LHVPITPNRHSKSSRITRRMLILLFVIPTLTMITILTIGASISRDLAEINAMRMSRQYAIEATANFHIFMNPRMQMMQQMSYSTAIARWLDNEYDEEARANALQAMIRRSATWPDAYYMFTSNHTLQAYDFHPGLSLEEFLSWGQVVEGSLASQWFFDVRDTYLPFAFNIQRSRASDEYDNYNLYIWSNHRIYYQDRLVGVFTLGSPFDDVFEATFGNFEIEQKRGYIIDRYGRVRLDSAGILETEVAGIPVFPGVPEAYENPNLLAAINNSLQSIQYGMYPLGTTVCDAILLEYGDFHYASISPIVGTDWAMLVLSRREEGLTSYYRPLIAATFLAPLIFMLAGGLMVRYMIVSPLNKLAKNTTEIGMDFEANVYGTNRNDEIGDISIAIQNMLRQIGEFQIKERKREIEERASFMLDTSPIATLLYDKDFKPIDCNSVLVNMFGFSEEGEFLKNIYTLAPGRQPDDRTSMEVINRHLEEAIEDGYSFMPEYYAYRANGETFPMEATFVRIRYKEDFAVIEYSRDISEEKQAEKLAQTYLDASPMCIELRDSDSNLIYCNQQVFDILEVSDLEEYIERFEELSPKHQPCGALSSEKYELFIKEAFSEGFVNFEWLHLTASGEPLPMDVTLVLVTLREKPALVSYSHDLRPIKAVMERERQMEIQLERQRVKVAEESNRAKTNFLARMSHEIRTPITAVMGISEIHLQNSELPMVLEESFAKIHNSANFLLGVVNDILDISKIEAGKMKLAQEEYAVIGMISAVAQPHPIYLSNKNVDFNLFVDDNLPTQLYGDVIRIEQIFNNLLSNAFKYTQAGSVDMTWQCSENESSKDYINLIVTISDTGLGMTKEQLEVLRNNEYTRFHEDDSRRAGGTGLGMPIVYSLLSMMDANIEIKSEVGKGTTLVVSIPQKLTEKTETIGREAADRLQQFEESAQSVGKKFSFVPEPMPYGNVLVVDDVEANLYVVKGLLAFYDINVDTCHSGQEAIEKIKDGKVYDIIFMDYMMPGLNGTETMHIMRDMGYTEPIVVLTANAMIGQAEEFIKSGFDGFVSKPIQTRHLNRILTKHIRNKQPAEVIEAALLAQSKKEAMSEIRAQTDINDFQSDDGLIEKLRFDFARRYANIFSDISNAIDANDIKTAHLLSHTLKSLAVMIHESSLAQIAKHLERRFANGEMPTGGELFALESALTSVLEDIGEPEIIDLHTDNLLDNDAALALFDKLEPLLSMQDIKSQDLLEELRYVPGTELLCQQIEDFDFGLALETLAALKAAL